jgi:hypothetical protein
MTDRQLLEFLVCEIQAVRAAVDRLVPPRRLSRDNYRLIRPILPLALERFGNPSEFLTRHVLEDSAFASCLVPLQTRAKGKPIARSLGRLFAAAADAGLIDGYRFERVREEHGAAIWRVSTLRLSGLETALKAA